VVGSVPISLFIFGKGIILPAQDCQTFFSLLLFSRVVVVVVVWDGELNLARGSTVVGVVVVKVIAIPFQYDQGHSVFPV
jgi:hypothetical protein